MKNLIIILSLFFLFGAYSCDKCRNALEDRESLLVNIVFKSSSTDENLFFGNGKQYELDDLNVFFKDDADALKSYSFGTFADYSSISLNTQVFGGNSYITTFYYQIQNNPLDTLNVVFNETEEKCHEGLYKSSYDITLNGQLVCDDCTYEDYVTVYK
jgi:hypothetical protein